MRIIHLPLFILLFLAFLGCEKCIPDSELVVKKDEVIFGFMFEENLPNSEVIAVFLKSFF